LAFVRFIEDTLWPNHPVRFFSALSLEKNAPSDSASVMYLVLALFRFSSGLGISNRRNAVGENIELTTTWRAGRREHWRAAAVSGDRTGMA
jgi:hypothetical protein